MEHIAATDPKEMKYTEKERGRHFVKAYASMPVEYSRSGEI